MLRDLHFEATTYVIQVFKEQASSDGTDTQVKRLPMPERTARALEQQQRLSGVTISGELQPSYNLIDKCNTIYETGALVWLAPSVCSKRDAEVSLGVNEKSPVVPFPAGSFWAGKCFFGVFCTPCHVVDFNTTNSTNSHQVSETL